MKKTYQRIENIEMRRDRNFRLLKSLLLINQEDVGLKVAFKLIQYANYK